MQFWGHEHKNMAGNGQIYLLFIVSFVYDFAEHINTNSITCMSHYFISFTVTPRVFRPALFLTVCFASSSHLWHRIKIPKEISRLPRVIWKDWQMQIHVNWITVESSRKYNNSDSQNCLPLVIIKWLERMWLNPAAGGQTAAVNHN